MKQPLSMPSAKVARITLVALCCAAFLAACGSNMRDESRIKPYEPIEFPAFQNNQSERPIDPNTVARSQSTDLTLTTGKTNGAVVTAFPITVSKDTIGQGQKLYATFCTPCHGAAADGKGIVSGYFKPPPANLLADEHRAQPVGHYFDVITNGYGIMFSYASRISPADRWAVIAYIRAMQADQKAPLDVSPDQIQQSGAAAGGAAK